MLTGFDLCRAAVAVEGISAPEQSVLMVLAIMADKQAQCWPSVSGLVSRTKLSERAVQNAVKALTAAGHLTRFERPGRGVIYTLHPQSADKVEASRSPAPPAPRTSCAPHDVRPASPAPSPAPPAPKQPRTTTSPKASPSPKRAPAAAVAFVPPSDIPEAEWEAFEDMRRRIKKPMTDKARSLAVERLRQLADDGWPPGVVLNHSTLNNYQGLFPPQDRRNGNRPHHDRSEPQNPMVRAVRNAEAREARERGAGLQPRMLS